MVNIILFGAPGTGKGTQSENIISKYKLIHLSTGDIMREEIAKGTQIGALAKSYIDKGLLVPDSVIFRNLYYRASVHKNSNGFIFDGFPRTINQAEVLDKFLNKKGFPIDMVLYLDVTEKESFNRIMYRAQRSNRTDDSEEIIWKRIEVYHQQTKPLLKYYEKQNKMVTIDGMGSIENVFGLISDEIDKIFSRVNSNL
ncbi:MAG TPA: adenylate kinase [Bacteroidales bacterium]|nr:adenylate kinase [Bacteroidales bacterium]